MVAALAIALGVAGCGTQATGGGSGDFAAAALSQAKQQVMDASTVRVVMRISDGTGMGVPGEVTGEGVLDMVQLSGRLTYHYAFNGTSVEALIRPEAVYYRLPQPQDGKTWVTVEGITGDALFQGMDREALSASLSGFSTMSEDKSAAGGNGERRLVQTITLDELRDSTGVAQEGTLADKLLGAMDVTSMTAELWVTTDRKISRMSIKYGDKMTIEMSDFGVALGDVTPPPADQVLVKQAPKA
ncbi:hypothetical protein [Yinghuangia soli]|uniref:LppX_LprAFG lipoprotein n=1 Tax=Yinghuangia soli TaxID=2908204 RepID=A0AA41Q1E2_9ACTN|nr:hypothetical protein [Yinghuangia soli]MCF2529417.1 hypothetical protein [Yinghuangia soli]